MRRHGGLFGVTALAVLAASAGCVESKRAGDGVRLTTARPIEPDIPIPQGFRLVESAGEDRSTGTRRLYLRHDYRGRADKHRARDFYREQMPLSRWTLMSDGNVKGDIQMRFEKQTESCTITITDRPGLFGGTRIQVIVAREDRDRVPPATRKSP